MPTSPNQKMKLLYLMKFLLERTDAEHSMTIAQMITALSEVGIKAERKSIYDDLKLLRQFGLDIEMRRDRSFGYYVPTREFELPELKLLVDAVLSSRFITQKKSAELVKKLSALTSEHQAKQLKRPIHLVDRPKSVNESIYYSIDAIHAAINTGRKISFKYFDYSLDKKRSYRKEGASYSETPLVLCWDDDKYYLVCYNSKHDGFAHYRVDRMSDVAVSDEPAEKFDRRRLNVSNHIKQVFGMYSGEVVNAKLRFDASLINVVLDRFGPDLIITPSRSGDKFTVGVAVSKSPVFLGWMAQYGDKAEVLSPASLRRSMAELAAQLTAMYVKE